MLIARRLHFSALFIVSDSLPTIDVSRNFAALNPRLN